MKLTKAQRQQLQLITAGGLPVPEELRSADPVEVRQVRAETGAGFRYCPLLPEDTQVVRRAVEEGGGGGMEFVASAEVVDRVGDIVRVRKTPEKAGRKGGTGLSSKNYLAAGAPLLWAHNRMDDLPPVGQVSSSRDERIDNGEGQKVWARIQRAEFQPDDDFPLSRTVANLALVTGSLRGVSIGFVPLDVDQVDDPKTREKMGLGPWGVVFTSSDQLELSMTPTPANPLALGVQGKSLVDVVERDVHRGLGELLQLGLLSKGAHSDLERLLLPMDGDTRARAKVRGFADMGAVIRSTGSWPEVGVGPVVQVEPEPDPGAVVRRQLVEGMVQKLDAELLPLPVTVETTTDVAREAGRLEATVAQLVEERDALMRERQLLAEQVVNLQSDLADSRETTRATLELMQEQRQAGPDTQALLRDAGDMPTSLRDMLFRGFEQLSDSANTLGTVVDVLDSMDTVERSEGVDQGPAGGRLLAQVARDVGRLAASGAADAAHGPGVAHAGDPVETGERNSTDQRVSDALAAVRALRTGAPAEG